MSPGVTVPAVGIEAGEPGERVAATLERRLDRFARADGQDPPLPAGHDRGLRVAWVVDAQPPDRALLLAAAHAARRR